MATVWKATINASDEVTHHEIATEIAELIRVSQQTGKLAASICDRWHITVKPGNAPEEWREDLIQLLADIHAGMPAESPYKPAAWERLKRLSNSIAA